MSKPKPAKPQPYQKSGGDWVRLDKSKLAFYQIGLSTEKDKARFLDSFTAGLVLGKLGLNALADDCLTEAAAYRELASINGKLGRKKQLEESGGPPATPGHPRPYSTDGTNNTIRDCTNSERGALTQSQSEIPSLEVFRSFGAKHGMDPVKVEKCFRHYEVSDWRDAKGHPVLNWKSKLSSWINRPELEASQPKRIEPKPGDDGREFKSTIRPRIIGSVT